MGALVLGVGLLAAAPAAGVVDDPVSVSVRAPGGARAGSPFTVRVTVTARAGGFAGRVGRVRLSVRLARRCGGVFAGASGPVLFDRPLRPAPRARSRYRVVVTPRARVRRAARLTVCAYVVDGADRQYATDTGRTIRIRGRR